MNYIFSTQEEQRGGNSIDVTSKGTRNHLQGLRHGCLRSTPAMNFFPCQDLIEYHVQCYGNEKFAMPKVRGLQHFWKMKVRSWWMTLWERSKTPIVCYFFLIHSAISSTAHCLALCYQLLSNCILFYTNFTSQSSYLNFQGTGSRRLRVARTPIQVKLSLQKILPVMHCFSSPESIQLKFQQASYNLSG